MSFSLRINILANTIIFLFTVFVQADWLGPP